MQIKSRFVSLGVIGLVCFSSMASFAEELNVFKQHGAVSWYELMTSDVDAAAKFYTQLFGWTEESQMADGSKYLTVKVNGKGSGQHFGISKIQPQAQGVPPYWGLYVTVNDVDATTKQAQEAGAKILVPAMDIPEINSRFSVIQDPQGAGIALITYRQPAQPPTSSGAAFDPMQQHGAVSWFELETTDVDAAIKFYAPLFGWATEESSLSDGSKYVLIKLNGKPVGGMMKTPPQAQGVPPCWMMYVTVKDLEATVKQAQALGGKILMPPTDLPGNARFSVVQDPQGAVVEIISYLPQKP